MATALLTAAGVSATTAATVSSVIGAVTSAASIGLGIATPLIQARNSAAVQQGIAAQYEQQARDREVQGAVDAARRRRQNRAVLAEQEARGAEATGLSGTIIDILDNNSVALELNALNVEYEASVDATSLRNDANAARAGASNARAGGVAGAIGAGIGSIDPLNDLGDRIVKLF